MSMQATGRRTRFQERVRVERMFLAPVNAIFGSAAPLAGMTATAIDSWTRRAEALDGGYDIAGIARLLREAAARAELLADASREVFQRGRMEGPDGLEALAAVVRASLAVPAG